jgi:hypothetical protein
MRPSIRCRLIALVRAQWAGLLALFLVIAGGTAYAANTIGSTDIINGQVKSVDIGTNEVTSADVRDDTLANGGLAPVDLRPGAVGTSEVADNALRGADIATGAVSSTKVADESLTGSDVAESTLDQVPSALVGGLGRQGAELAACDPETNEFVFCKNSQLFDVPSGGARALVLARLGGASNSGAGRCRLGTSSIGVMPDTDQIVSGLENTTLVGVTDLLPPGPTDFAVDCNETGGEMIYGELAVSAVLISTG